MWRVAILALLLALTLPATSQGGLLYPRDTTYYVAPNGSDANPGTTQAPWRTFAHATARMAAGDTLLIRGGVYAERLTPQHSGAPSQPITFAAYPGETATIDGATITLPDDLAGLVQVQGVANIVIRGLGVINAGPHGNNAGILILDAHNITVTGNSTADTQSSGISAWGGDHIVIRGNTVLRAGSGGWQECITAAGIDGFEVMYNTVLDCEKEGIDAKDGAANGSLHHNRVERARALGIYVDAWDKHTYNIDVFANVVVDTVDGNGFAVASEAGGLLENVHLYNNVAYRNRYVGIVVSINGDGGPMRNIQIINNTLADNGTVAWGGGITVDNPAIEQVTVRNNIVSQNLYFQLAIADGVPAGQVTVDHNLVDGFRETEGETYGNDPVVGEPRFADRAAGNFHLLPGSPAIDAGAATGAPAVDFEGEPRPADGDHDGIARVDIGADELAHSAFLPLVTHQHVR